MEPKISEKICPSCGCKEAKNIPFTDGKIIKQILACRRCGVLIDKRIVEVIQVSHA
jgi:hypothetical protein